MLAAAVVRIVIVMDRQVGVMEARGAAVPSEATWVLGGSGAGEAQIGAVAAIGKRVRTQRRGGRGQARAAAMTGRMRGMSSQWTI